MFQWYEKENGQKVEPAVIDRLFYETGGQPGLTCWFGELLTEGFEDYTVDKTRPIGMREFERVYGAAIYALPNNNILNIISKARQEANKTLILEMFQTDEKLFFTFDDPIINALYMNGVVDKEVDRHNRYYLRFSCPFVQKRPGMGSSSGFKKFSLSPSLKPSMRKTGKFMKRLTAIPIPASLLTPYSSKPGHRDILSISFFYPPPFYHFHYFQDLSI